MTKKTKRQLLNSAKKLMEDEIETPEEYFKQELELLRILDDAYWKIGYEKAENSFLKKLKAYINKKRR